MPRNRSSDRLTTGGKLVLPSLPSTDARQLRHWLQAVQPAGIETVADLGNRDWDQPRPCIILGVFRRGEEQARWLIAGQAGRWVAACPGDRRITEPAASLLEVLQQIHKAPLSRAGR